MAQGTGAAGRVRRGGGRARRSLVLGLVTVTMALAACDGQLAHHAGTGVGGYSGDGGPATDARFGWVGDMVVIPSGGFYVVDSSYCVIRKVPAGGSPVTTVAGTGVCGDDGDGPDATSRRIDPRGDGTRATHLALEPDGGLLFADVGNGVIRRVGADGSLTTVAGQTPVNPNRIGYCDAQTTSPTGVAVAPDGTIYVSCEWGGVYRVDPGGALVHAGLGGWAVAGIDVAPDGRIWMLALATSLSANTISRFDPVARSVDLTIRLPTRPTAATLEPTGRALVAYGNQVWQYSESGEARLVAGNGSPDPGGAVQTGAALDGALTPTALAAGRYGLLVASRSVVYHTVVAGMATGCPNARAGADLRRASLRGCDLSGRDLTGADLSGADLSGADLSGAVLAGATVTGPGSPAGTTWFEGVRLTGADLTGVDLATLGSGALRDVVTGGVTPPASLPPRWAWTPSGYLVGPGANLDGAGLAGEDLRGLDLAGASIDGTDLTDALLGGVASGAVRGVPLALPAAWRLSGGFLVGPGADLRAADIRDADLSGVDLAGADLVGVQMRGVDLSGVDLAGADLRGALFSSVDLTGSDLSGTDLASATFTSADLTGVSFAGADLRSTNFATLDLRGADLTGARADGTDFNGVDLSGMDLSVLAFESGGRYSGTLASSDLTGANVDGIDFSAARLSGLRAPGLVGTVAGIPADARLVGQHLVTASPNLRGLDVSGYDFRGLTMTSADITGTNLTGANLDGLEMYFVVGTPSALPGPGYKLVNVSFVRRLIGPRMNLRNINFNGVNLAGLDVSGANLDRSTFTGATGTPTGGATATYNLTTCPDGVRVSAPDTCVGRGFAA